MSDRVETVRIICDDQRSLAASLYPAAPASDALSSTTGVTVIVNSATGVKRAYYDGFARFRQAVRFGAGWRTGSTRRLRHRRG